MANGTIDAADEDGIPNDCDLFHDSGFAGTSTFTQSVNRIDPHTVQISLHGWPADPLIIGSPHIDWNLTITIDTTDPNRPHYTINGTHDGFPDHEIYILRFAHF